MSAFTEFDEISYWSEVKLDIVRDYASAYSRILNSKNLPHVYVDAFAGAGQHISRNTGSFVAGSPLNALNVQPTFKEFHFIDLNSDEVEHLRKLVGQRKDVKLHHGDCNEILLKQIFPTLRFETYRRALCLLDPYGLDLDWTVIGEAGELGTVDMFLNFLVMDMNRNALWRNPDRVRAEQAQRMTKFWGDESWKTAAYSTAGNLFDIPEKEPNDVIAQAFRKRLMEAAGFRRVPAPIPMRNRTGATVYYLFFASQVGVAEDIVNDIFRKYSARGGSE